MKILAILESSSGISVLGVGAALQSSSPALSLPLAQPQVSDKVVVLVATAVLPVVAVVVMPL
jgi:hypothetical protein